MPGWTERDLPDLVDRVAIVTGANSGIGFETARALAHRGAHVVLACRAADRGRSAKERIDSEAPSGCAELGLVDLSDLDSVASFASGFSAAHGRLDLLVNNAGVWTPPRCRTAQGYEAHLGTNHFGHFALTGRLLPLLFERSGARIVLVASLAHHLGQLDFEDPHFERRTYRGFAAYSQSKLANLSFAMELNRRLVSAGASARAMAAHPGWTATGLFRAAPVIRHVPKRIAMSPVQGARPILRAACEPGLLGGEYFGPAGPFGLTGRPTGARVSARARDPIAAGHLWALSERSTGVTFGLGERELA